MTSNDKIRELTMLAIDSLVALHAAMDPTAAKIVVCGYDPESDMTALISLNLIEGKVDRDQYTKNADKLLNLDPEKPTLTLVPKTDKDTLQ